MKRPSTAIRLLTMLLGVGLAAHANAQGTGQGAGNPTLLDAIQSLQAQVAALQDSLANSGTARRYYLTDRTYNGADAPQACSQGFHMASVWELLPPGSLKYDATLGVTAADAGNGPPTSIPGWSRTGNAASGNAGPAGVANCDGYTSASPTETGTIVGLPSALSDDQLNPGLVTSPWFWFEWACSNETRVWCVQD